MPWLYNPDEENEDGIPLPVQQRTEKRIRDYARENYTGDFLKIDIRFSDFFCYIDAYVEPDRPDEGMLKLTGQTEEEYLIRRRNQPIHLCRLEYENDEDRWQLAFFTYSHEKYEPCNFHTGSSHGTPEDAFETAAVYLRDE